MAQQKNAEDYWNSYVYWYESYLNNSPYKHLIWRRLSVLLEGKNSFLDIGAGTGVFALAAAEKVSKVCCVEFSSQMRQRICEQACEQGKNIDCLASDWEELLPEQLGGYDVVLAAHSFYQMKDISAAFGKMLAVANRELVVVTNANHSQERYFNIRKHLEDNKVKTNRPKVTPHYEEIMFYLSAAGTFPALEIVEYDDGYYYNNQDEAASHTLLRLGVSESEKHIINEALAKSLTTVNGKICLPWRSKIAVIICRKE